MRLITQLVVRPLQLRSKSSQTMRKLTVFDDASFKAFFYTVTYCSIHGPVWNSRRTLKADGNPPIVCWTFFLVWLIKGRGLNMGRFCKRRTIEY